ncbi:hypothetical protein [Nonomuraea gerenzanensis]|uniref:Uncharacterized protein n=1 Tax=Nonomuraea gerenzanensis TaxID=93944 RepID=A0A1M4EGK0_9ACTN|nr:hypothetical protein [Nonomuraea gerenzanensis]UBU09441.1 hypothetical protein LCN96_34395 [Nonomuraea gerenzanensis]SBO97856.1 hypothetical protein BN4615_P7372 [Nonomuraea gerenzanensis]
MIFPIVTHLWAAAGRYRLGRLAAVAVAFYLAAVAATTGYAIVSRDLSALSVTVTGLASWPRFVGGGRLGPLLVAIGVFNAWMLWQVLRGPALPRAEGSPRDVVWLRRLLYLGIAADLVFWEVLDELSGVVVLVGSRVLWAVTMIVWVRVLTGMPASLRAAGLALGLIGALPLVLLPDAVIWQGRWVLGLASIAFTVMILLGQRRDGRWSGATVAIGWLALIAPLILPLLHLVLPDEAEDVSRALALVADVLETLTTVWLARTAHELARSGAATGSRPVTHRGTRLLLSVAVVLPLLAIGAEEEARYSFTGTEEDCGERIRPFAETRPQDRRRTFLCLARDDSVESPIFPRNLPDRQVLAHGDRLCAMPAVKDRQEWLRRTNEPPGMVRLGDALEFLCPGAAARHRAEQARVQREREREQAAWQAELAEMNTRCADPWPKVRAARQGTAAYLLFEGGGYYVYDDRDGTDGDPYADMFEAIEDGFVHAAGGSAAITTFGENEPMCMTVKAFRKAPPLRLKGWAQVVEVGIASRSGRIVVPPYPEGGDSGALAPLPSLAVDGPGRYRMRIYARTEEWDEADPEAPVEEHLIVVYPGRSAKKVVHRTWAGWGGAGPTP